MKQLMIAALATTLALSTGAVFAQASGAMSNDAMSHDAMKKNDDMAMSHDKMGKNDSKMKMKKHDAMGKMAPASGAMAK